MCQWVRDVHCLLDLLAPCLDFEHRAVPVAQAALQQRLKALALERKNEQRAGELAAVVAQAELQRAQKEVKQLTQELEDEQASAERSARRAALECHSMRKVRRDARMTRSIVRPIRRPCRESMRTGMYTYLASSALYSMTMRCLALSCQHLCGLRI